MKLKVNAMVGVLPGTGAIVRYTQALNMPAKKAMR